MCCRMAGKEGLQGGVRLSQAACMTAGSAGMGQAWDTVSGCFVMFGRYVIAVDQFASLRTSREATRFSLCLWSMSGVSAMRPLFCMRASQQIMAACSSQLTLKRLYECNTSYGLDTVVMCCALHAIGALHAESAAVCYCGNTDCIDDSVSDQPDRAEQVWTQEESCKTHDHWPFCSRLPVGLILCGVPDI